MKTPDQNLDWTRACKLLADLKLSTRRSLSAQVLLGGELKSIKGRLGSARGAHKTGSIGRFGRMEETWDSHCQTVLGIAERTANRYIQIFESGRTRVLARKNAAKRENRPEDFALWERVCVLMDSPSAELTGDELEELAVHVHELVDHDTQAGLLEELGIKKAPHKLTGGDTSAHRKEREWGTLDDQAIMLFSSVVRRFGEVEKEIFGVRTHAHYQFLLEELPLTSDEDGKPCLMGIKECLEEILNGKLGGLVKELDAAIERKMHGPPPKRVRRKSPKSARK